MRYVIQATFLIALVSCQPAEQSDEPAAPQPTPAAAGSMDATVVAPDQYEIALENDRVRVLLINYAAGDETAIHSHPDGVAVFLEEGSVEMVLPDGTTQERPGKAGEVVWAAAETHEPKALTDISVVLVELKDGAGEAAAGDFNAPVVAPDHYQVELDNDRVRVLRITYAAGDETAIHSHPDGVVIFLEDGSVEMTLPDGTAQERPGTAGDVLWAAAETHAPKALTDISVILVELKGNGG